MTWLRIPRLSGLVNSLWMLSCRSDLNAFRAATRDVALAQPTLLLQMIRRNENSLFGREHRFNGIRDVDEYRGRVPIADYEQFAPWIQHICDGATEVLTTEPVRLLEPTSGSVSGRRLIPYTDSLKRQFLNGIHPWVADLLSCRPALRSGRAYWSVSPPRQPELTRGGLSIGFDDDTQYLGLTGRIAARAILAVPPGMLASVDTAEAPYRTVRQLLTVRDLTLISIWSPTFLLTLIRVLLERQDQLLKDIRDTCGREPADELATILRITSIPEKLARLWPHLTLISCWADGSSVFSVAELREYFPKVEIQAKGLISTEAFVSLPMCSLAGSALAVRSHFFEFQPVESDSDCTLLSHQLSAGQRYRVIVTTGGGFYRYQTHDVVEVTGFLEHCPLIQFCGRSNRTSDLVGEKLSDAFVASVLRRLALEMHLRLRFAMLVPSRTELRYRLLLEPEDSENSPSASRMAALLDQLLSENPWYDHAIRFGQLKPSIVILGQCGQFQVEYETKCLEAGIRRGDIKPAALETRFLWD